MRGLKELPDEYFDKYKDKKVKILPFNPQTKIIAKDYIDKLKELLKDFDVEIMHRGSTSFGIAGKGEIEVGVFPKEEDWKNIIELLTTRFGEPGNIEESYARFNDFFQDTEIEIILMKGDDTRIDKALNRYLMEHPELLKEYENTKYKYANSKKDYMIQKDKFFRKVVAMIPENY